jgi:hypothetical protein
MTTTEERIKLKEEEKYIATVASFLDQELNAGFDKKTIGFVLLLFPFGEQIDGRVNYVSSAERKDAIEALKTLLERWQAEENGSKGDPGVPLSDLRKSED